jgi:hypothetical protein
MQAKKRRNTGGILSIFPEIMRQIGGAGGGKALISVSLEKQSGFDAPV